MKHILNHPLVIFSFFLICSVLVLYAPTVGFMKYQYDDSYITYRYAINLAEGKGLVFNTYEKADSASAFTYTVLLAAAYKTGIKNLEAVAVVISLISLVGTSYFVVRSIQSQIKNNFIAYLFGYLVGIHGFISGWAISGMETVFFTLLVTWFISSYFFQKQTHRILHVILLSLILLTRMEGVILVGVWFMAEGMKQIKQKDIPALRSFITQTFFLGVVFVSFYLFKYVYYGSIVSTAVAFKQIATYYLPNPKNLLIVWSGTSLLVSLLAGYTLIKHLQKYWAICLFVILSGVSLIMGPNSDGARYSVHLLPLVYILAGVTSNTLYKDFRKKIYIQMLVLAIICQTLMSTFVVRHFMMNLMSDQQCRQKVGMYIKETLPKDTYILAGDLGLIAYTAIDHPFIDISGLTSTAILEQYEKKEVIDPVLQTYKPRVLADSFFRKEKGLTHKLLSNQAEHISGQKIYSHLFRPSVFKQIIYTCDINKRAFAIIDISDIYK